MPDLIADAAIDAVARAIATVQREAERSEALRAAEHRAFMAEQRESLAEMRRMVETRMAEVKDGADGKDGEQGPQGEPGEPGPPGEQGPEGPPAYAGEAKGLYDAEATYRAMDVVSFNGSEWRAKQDDPGPLPGDGWMLSAQRGKRGSAGERGERGIEGKSGKDGAQPIALKFDDDEGKFVMILDSGEQLDADMVPILKAIRGE